MKRILLISLAVLAMLFVSCSGDTPSGVSMNIPAQYHGEWTGALEKVVISAHDIEITSSCVGKGVYRLSDYASLDSIVIDQSYDGFKFTAPYSDNLSNNATQITVSISGTKDKISLEIEGNDEGRPYISSIFLVPVSDTISNQTLSVPSFLHGNFIDSQEGFPATISEDNISIKTYGYMEPDENDEWQIAILDFNAHKDDLDIIYRNNQEEEGIYEIIFSLTEGGHDFRFAWRFEERSDGFQLRFSCINDFGYSHGGSFYSKDK